MSEKERISINVDKEIKDHATAIFEALGMNLTTAITLFLNQSIQDQALPFQPHLKPKSYVKPPAKEEEEEKEAANEAPSKKELKESKANNSATSSQENSKADLLLSEDDSDTSFDIWFD